MGSDQSKKEKGNVTMKVLLLCALMAATLTACGPQPSVSTPVTDASGNVVGQVQQQQGPSFGEQVAAAGLGAAAANMIGGALRGGGHGAVAPAPVVHRTTVINQTVVQRKNVTINRPRPTFNRPSYRSSFPSRRR